nr:PadR family transcriptional regulator [Clostridium sartagoforme]
MSIKLAILGILSWKPSTGYELKKIFEESSFLYWSGNNNQIYKSLIKMEDEHLVTSEIIHQDNSPSKKYIL